MQAGHALLRCVAHKHELYWNIVWDRTHLEVHIKRCQRRISGTKSLIREQMKQLLKRKMLKQRK